MVLSDKNVSRRGFLRGAAVLAAGAASLPALQGLGLLSENGRVIAAPGDGGYGPLVPTPDLRDGVERISLPEGFQYRSFGVTGTPMTRDGLTPLALDGMAVFNIDGRFRLVRNHEDRNNPNGTQSVGGPANTRYDPEGPAGTTTLVVNPFSRELESDWVSLNGTIVNCAGGPTPWGSWITCEETNQGVGNGWMKQHGYCFEVPASANSTVPATPIIDMGRFAHEAVAVDPSTGMVYETEDDGNESGFYRYIPNVPGNLLAGGQLQILGVARQPAYDTYTGHAIGTQLPVTWYEIANPDPAPAGPTVFDQGRSQGAAAFGRLEGAWYAAGAIYFVSTSGGSAGVGQIWEYRPSTETLTLVFESSSSAELDGPDNITVSPSGNLLLCEDGDDDQFLRGLTQDGKVFDFAGNLLTRHEWAGACFAVADPAWNARATRGSNRPLGGRSDRITLFVNRQGSTSGSNPPAPGNEGMTFAIWGPWEKGAL